MKKDTSSSKYLGVSAYLHNSKYINKKGDTKIYSYRYNTACIQHNGIAKYLGLFKSEEDAALAYNEAAIKYHGEFANLNIIDEMC